MMPSSLPASSAHSRRLWFLKCLATGVGLAAAGKGGGKIAAQEPEKPKALPLSDFRPEPRLRTPDRTPLHAKFPVVDIHTHFRIRTRQSREMLRDFVQLMDRNRIAVCVSLDGGIGDAIDEHRQHLEEDYPQRFLVFANLDFRGKGAADDPRTWDCNQPDFVRRCVESLKDAKRRGARGLKFFKDFGLGYRGADGKLLQIDDERFDPIWATCGELGLPVLMHTADPSAFFLPIDEKNERYEELSRRPEWSFYGPQFPSRESLLEARNRVIGRHPKTQFIAAHFANDAEDLEQAAEWLERYPNLHLEIASRISELGRQPYSARAFFLKYADRILFGTDGPWPEERLRLYWRFLETFDEYFPYSEKPFPPQGFWRIYGIGLPDEVLKKVYQSNAAKLLSIDERWLAWPPERK